LDEAPAARVRVPEEPVVTPVQRRIHAPVEPAFESEPVYAAEPVVSPRVNARPAYDETEIDYPDDAEDDAVPFEPDMPLSVPAHTQRGDSRFHPVDHSAPRVTAPAP